MAIRQEPLLRSSNGRMYRNLVFVIMLWLMPLCGMAQFNTDRLVTIGRSALYYEDYVLSIQYFNQAIMAKPYLSVRRTIALKRWSATHM